MRTTEITVIVLAAIVAASPVIWNATAYPPGGALEEVREQAEEIARLTTLMLTVPGVSGCTDGAIAGFAALPGQPSASYPVSGCRTLVFEKEIAGDVQVAVSGGSTNLLCDWRPLEPASCSGLWGHHTSGAVVHLAIRGGTPGAVTFVGF